MIRNYLIGDQGFVIGNEGRPVLQEISYETVFERLKANYERWLENRARNATHIKASYYERIRRKQALRRLKDAVH